MEYHYFFYEDPQVIAAEVTTTFPLPGIAFGNELILSTEHFGRTGGVLHIRHVRTVISHFGGNFQRYEIHVVCEFDDPVSGI